jgi:hypothetical protein
MEEEIAPFDYEVNESDTICNRTRGRCRRMGPHPSEYVHSLDTDQLSPPTMHLSISSLLLFSATFLGIHQMGLHFTVGHFIRSNLFKWNMLLFCMGIFKLDKVFLLSRLLN